MQVLRRGGRWFTLGKVPAVLAAVTLLAVVATLNIPSFLTAAGERAYVADQRFLQKAVSAYRADMGNATGSLIPTLDGEVGTPQEGRTPSWQCNGIDADEICSWIDMGALKDGDYLDEADAVASADTDLNTTATNSPAGSYGWYIDSEGTVESSPPFSHDTGYP